MRDHAAEWAAAHHYQTVVDDRLIDEWARLRNGIIPGPLAMRHSGRHGQHGEWPMAAYRRLLAAIRLRETGATDVSTIRLRLRFAGHRIPDRFAAEDLAHAYRKVLRQARREVPLLPGGRLREVPPLRLRREVEKAVRYFQSGLVWVPEGLGGVCVERLRAYPHLEAVSLAIVDLMYQGPEKPVLERLKSVATLLPPWLLEKPGDIVEAMAGQAGSLAPPDGSNLVIDALTRARPEDVQTADAFMRWVPLFLQWAEDNSAGIDPSAADHIREMCMLARTQLSRIPLDARVIWHAMLTAHYVRYREGLVTWAPGIAFAADANTAA